jgi:hypothetical protein
MRIADALRGVRRSRAASGKVRVQLQADDVAGQTARGRRTDSRCRFRFPEHLRQRLRQQRLQGAAFEHRLHHRFAVAERQLKIGIGQARCTSAMKTLARQRGQGLQHAAVQYVPGANLLFDHGFAGLGVIDRHAGKVIRRGGLAGHFKGRLAFRGLGDRIAVDRTPPTRSAGSHRRPSSPAGHASVSAHGHTRAGTGRPRHRGARHVHVVADGLAAQADTGHARMRFALEQGEELRGRRCATSGISSSPLAIHAGLQQFGEGFLGALAGRLPRTACATVLSSMLPGEHHHAVPVLMASSAADQAQRSPGRSPSGWSRSGRRQFGLEQGIGRHHRPRTWRGPPRANRRVPCRRNGCRRSAWTRRPRLAIWSMLTPSKPSRANSRLAARRGWRRACPGPSDGRGRRAWGRFAAGDGAGGRTGHAAQY